MEYLRVIIRAWHDIIAKMKQFEHLVHCVYVAHHFWNAGEIIRFK